jgi:hypothetical protein
MCVCVCVCVCCVMFILSKDLKPPQIFYVIHFYYVCSRSICAYSSSMLRQVRSRTER